MNILHITLWLLSGLLGSYLVWLQWVIEFENYKCLTPRAIVLIFCGSVVGLSMLIAAIAIFLIEWIENHQAPGWWSRPICGKYK